MAHFINANNRLQCCIISLKQIQNIYFFPITIAPSDSVTNPGPDGRIIDAGKACEVGIGRVARVVPALVGMVNGAVESVVLIVVVGVVVEVVVVVVVVDGGKSVVVTRTSGPHLGLSKS